MKEIYLDNSASTMVDPKVVTAMIPFLTGFYGNASSLHTFGREAKAAMEHARSTLASFIGAVPAEIVFTSSGTESNNFALKGIAFAHRHKGNHIIVSAIEHDSILNPCRWLEGQGFTISYLPVDREGVVDRDALEKTIRKDTILVSVMHANNEIGTIEPIAEIASLCRQHQICFHSDACQSFGKVPIDVQTQCVDLLTINAHKIYGPKGVGALFIRGGTNIMPWQHGGGHEMGLRSATENIPAIVGFAKAAELCFEELDAQVKRLRILREKIINTVCREISFAYVNGHRTERLAHNVNIGFHGLEGDAIKLMLMLDEMGIAVSSGSACSSHASSGAPSHVLSAIGLDPVRARGALRISLGRYTTEEEVDYFLDSLFTVLKKLKPIVSVLM